MKIKTTVGYYPTTIRMTAVKKWENNKCLVRLWRNWNPWALMIEYKMIQMLWKKFATSSKKNLKQNIMIWSSNSISENMYSKELKEVSWSKIFAHPCSWQHSQYLEQGTNSSVRWRVKRSNIWPTHTTVLSSLTKKGNSSVCYSMDEP